MTAAAARSRRELELLDALRAQVGSYSIALSDGCKTVRDICDELAALAAARLALQQENHALLLKLAVIQPSDPPKDVRAWADRLANDAEVADRVEHAEARAAAAEAALTALRQELAQARDGEHRWKQLAEYGQRELAQLRQDLQALPRHNIVHIADLFGRREGGVDGMWISARDLADRLARLDSHVKNDDEKTTK